MRRILALLNSRSVCSRRRKIAVPFDRVVGAHALEGAAAVVQRVGQHVDLGVAPVHQLAVHPDLAVAVGHRHGSSSQGFRRTGEFYGAWSVAASKPRPQLAAAGTAALDRASPPASLQAQSSRACRRRRRACGPGCCVSAMTCSIVMPGLQLRVAASPRCRTWPTGAWPAWRSTRMRAAELQQQPEHHHADGQQHALPAVGIPGERDEQGGQRPAYDGIHGRDVSEARPAPVIRTRVQRSRNRLVRSIRSRADAVFVGLLCARRPAWSQVDRRHRWWPAVGRSSSGRCRRAAGSACAAQAPFAVARRWQANAGVDEVMRSRVSVLARERRAARTQTRTACPRASRPHDFLSL